MDELTFNEHIAAALKIAQDARQVSTSVAAPTAESSAAARDLSLSITHLEDANTRYNSARYHQMGIWKRADPDKVKDSIESSLLPDQPNYDAVNKFLANAYTRAWGFSR